MKRLVLLAVMLGSLIGLARTVVVGQSPVVGYINSEIKRGLNEIKIEMDSIDLFPTLDKVVQFSPPENAVGDEFIFDLDGKHRKYRIVASDGTNLVMEAKAPFMPAKIGLDWIPLRDRIWLNHVTTNQLTFGTCGAMNDEIQRRLDPRAKAPARKIEIRLVNDKNECQRILFAN